MKNLIRFSLVILATMIGGTTLMLLVEMRDSNLVAADRQVLPKPLPRRADSWQQPQPPVVINEVQIMLKMIVLDLDREKMAEAEIDFGTLQVTTSKTPTKQLLSQLSIVSQREAHLFVKSLVAKGAAKILAEPILVTTDNHRAKFVSGGEFPLLIPQAQNNVSIEYIKFGTTIDFLPRKLANGKLRLEIRVDQTDLDPSSSIEVNGVKIPGLNTRMVDSAFELQAGQTAMLVNGELLVIITPEFVTSLRQTDIAAKALQVPAIPAPPQPSALPAPRLPLPPRLRPSSPLPAIPPSPIELTAPPQLPPAQRLPSPSLPAPPPMVAQPRLPAPQRTAPRARRPSGKALVTLTALVYTFDAKMTQADGVDVHEMLSETESLGETSSGTGREMTKAIVSVIGPRTVATLIRRLSLAKGVDLLSRPQIRTFSGQSGLIQIGQSIRIPKYGDVLQASGEFQDVGIEIDVIPVVIGDLLRLETQAWHSQLRGDKVESISLSGVAELHRGETLAICQNDEDDEQLLLLVTFAGVEYELNSPPSPAVYRSHPRPEQTTEVAPGNPYNDQQKQVEAQKKDPLLDLSKVIQQLFPDDKVTLHALPDGVVVSGTISDPQHVNVLINIAENFFPQVHNNLTIGKQSANIPRASNAKPKDLQTVLDELFPDEDIKTYPLNNSVILIGVADQKTITQVNRIAEDFFPNVINHLTDGGNGKSPTILGDIPRVAADEVARGGLENQMRELRQDVKLLRGSVNQLIELLREQGDEARIEEADLLDSQSSNTPTKEPVAVAWETIGIRVEPTEVVGSRYRGGLQIVEVRPDSPAGREGMRPGDVLVGLDKWETIESDNLTYALDHVEKTKADRLKFYILRGSETLFGHLRFAAQPKPTNDADEENNSSPSAATEPTTD